MKNISRRVFIKGLAVAGVAAAASTVLAGCNTNMIPGVDDGSEDEGTETPTNQKITLTDTSTDKSMTIEATSFKYVSETNLGIIAIHADNQLGEVVKFAATAPTATGAYSLVVSLKTIDVDGNVDDTITGTAGTDNTNALLDKAENATADNAFGTGGALVDNGLVDKDAADAKIYLDMPATEAAKKNWKTLEVTLQLMRKYGSTGAAQVVAYDTFTFNK